MHTEEYWNLLKARTALGKLSVHEVMEDLGMNQSNICNKMRNKARAVHKALYIGHVSKDCFLNLMNDIDFSVRKWEILMNTPGNLDRGFKFYIEGHHLYYSRKKKEISCKPLSKKQYELLNITKNDSSLLFLVGKSKSFLIN